METQKNIKNEITIPITNTLTVVVVDKEGKAVEGASVSIKPSDASLTTNKVGEVQFKLGVATKYEITATTDSAKVTVPYYVTPNGATRLVVNPVYVKSIEAQLNPSNYFSSPAIVGGGIILAIIIFVIAWRYFRGK